MNDKEYLRKLQKDAKASAKKVYGSAANREKMGMENRGEKPPYDATTYLYIRAYDGDYGARPVPPGTVFWLSPDVELFDSAGTRITATDINTGQHYTVEVTVTNDGDQNCNACMVELYLDDPSIGFSVAASSLLGSVTIPVNSHDKAVASFPFTASAAMAGHKCLFARAYSFLSNELPLDFVAFNAVEDRHLGQQNLNIVKQNTLIDFMIHLEIGQLHTNFALMLKTDKKILRQIPNFIRTNFNVVPIAITAAAFNLQPHAGPLNRLELGLRPGVGTAAIKPPSRPPRATTRPDLSEALNRKRNTWNHKFEQEFNKLRLQIPDMGLKKGEATPLNLWMKDEKTGKIVGGITFLVTG